MLSAILSTILSTKCSISILLCAYGLLQIEGYTDPELTVHHDGVSMTLICSARPGVTGYTWKLNSNTIPLTRCTDTHSEFMSSHCYPNGTGTLIIKDGWTGNPLGTWMCIVYYPNATYHAKRNISAHDAVLLNQIDSDNIVLTCSYIMPNNIQGFRWTMGETVIGTYWSGSCTPIGTAQLPGYSVKCEGKKNMTLVVQPETIMDSTQEWTCGVGIDITDGYIESITMELSDHMGQGSSFKKDAVILICGVVGACLVMVPIGVVITIYTSRHRSRQVAQSSNRTSGRPVELQHYCTIDEPEPEHSRKNDNNEISSSSGVRTNVNKRADQASTQFRKNAFVEKSEPVGPKAAPFIKLENIIRVHVNETAVLRIDVLSKPPPVFYWYKLTATDGWTPIKRFKHMVVLNESRHSTLIIPEAGPQNEGKYKVMTSNGYGKPFIQEYEVIFEDATADYVTMTNPPDAAIHQADMTILQRWGGNSDIEFRPNASTTENGSNAANRTRSYANVEQSVPD